MYPKVDYLECRGVQLRKMKAVAIIYQSGQAGQNEVVTYKDLSNAERMFSHLEAQDIFNEVLEFLTFLYGLEPIAYGAGVMRSNENGRCVQDYALLGSLNEFDIFAGQFDENLQLGLAMTNDYGPEGQLEFMIWYRYDYKIFPRWAVLPFYKWTANNSSYSSNDELRIGYDYANFDDRDEFIRRIAAEIKVKIMKELNEFNDLVLNLQQLTIDSELALPVMLDIRNLNRSKTGVIANGERLGKIRSHISYYEDVMNEILRNNHEVFRYDHFLAFINSKNATSRSSFKQFSKALTASNEYKDLKNKVDSLLNEDFRAEYEREQWGLYNELRES